MRHRLLHRLFWSAVTLLTTAVLVLLLVHAVPGVPATAALAGATPSSVPRRGGTLQLAYPSDIGSLDPANSFDVYTQTVARLLFHGLLDYDDGTRLVPAQAQDWDPSRNISSDGRSYTFQLRPGVRFANGREVEAEDYVFTFERVLSPKTASWGQTYFLDILGAQEFVDGKAAHVKGLRAPDKGTLVIELKEPNFTFRYVLTMTCACAVPREVVQQYGAAFQFHPIGSGPYRLAESQRGIFWRLERNPCYQGSDGFVDGVELMIGGDRTTLAMMLERGELDQVASIAVADAIRFKRDPRLRSWLTRADTADTYFLFMNTEMKPFDDVRVRRAVNYAINRERLIKMDGGFSTVAHGVVPPSMPWTNPGLPRYEFDPEKARVLLREAGYPNGCKTELWCTYGSRLPEAIQQDLHLVGIEAELKIANTAAYMEKIGTRHQVPCGLMDWPQDYPDPSDYLDVLLNGARITGTACNNYAFYNNPEVNQCLDAAAISMNPDERTRLFRQAENLIVQDAPWAPLIHPQTLCLYHPRVHGTAPHPVWLWRYERMWLDP
jgi:oligopeptide transport system substrate-binding protein